MCASVSSATREKEPKERGERGRENEHLVCVIINERQEGGPNRGAEQTRPRSVSDGLTSTKVVLLPARRVAELLGALRTSSGLPNLMRTLLCSILELDAALTTPLLVHARRRRGKDAGPS